MQKQANLCILDQCGLYREFQTSHVLSEILSQNNKNNNLKAWSGLLVPQGHANCVLQLELRLHPSQFNLNSELGLSNFFSLFQELV